MHLVLGSTSSHKLDAVRQACHSLGLQVTIEGIKAASGQNEQPVGFKETFAGALTRAQAARSRDTQAVAIGIESGIFHIPRSTITLDIAVIVLLTLDGLQIVTTTNGVQFPKECVKIAKKRGFNKTTVGAVIAEKFGGDPNDPHATITQGKVTRTGTLIPALVSALEQLGYGSAK